MLVETRIAVRLAIADPALAERMAAILSEVDSIEIVPEGGEADLVIAQPQEDSGDIARGGRGGLAVTAREAEVLALLAEGASNKVIARRLGISVHTAKFHVATLLDKLDALGRTDAVVQAARRGLILL